MAEGPNAACNGRALVVGHSFMFRLGRFVNGAEGKIRGHKIDFWGYSGANVMILRQKALGWDLSKFCILYVELGSNDLCGCQSAEAFCQDLLGLVHLLLLRGATKVVVGEILYRGKMRAGGLSLEAYNAKVSLANQKLREETLTIDNMRVWTHDRVCSAALLSHDGVHPNARGMRQYWKSVRDALLVSLHK